MPRYSGENGCSVATQDRNEGVSGMPPPHASRLQIDTQSSDSSKSTQQSQKIGDIVIETRNDQNKYNTRHTVSVRVNKKGVPMKTRQQKYWELHKEQINQRRRESRKRKHDANLQPTADCSNFKIIEKTPDSGTLKKKRDQKYRLLHREELKQRAVERRKQNKTIINDGLTAHSSNLQPIASCSNVDSIEPAPEPGTLKKINRQERYRELHREELKQRQAERRKRQKNGKPSVTPFNVHNIDTIQINNKVITNDEQRAYTSDSDGLEGTQDILVAETTERINKKGVLMKTRQQKYWELHKEQINERRREIRKRQHDANLKLTPDSGTLKKNRDKKYRELHREELKQRRIERRKRNNKAIINDGLTAHSSNLQPIASYSNIDSIEPAPEPGTLNKRDATADLIKIENIKNDSSSTPPRTTENDPPTMDFQVEWIKTEPNNDVTDLGTNPPVAETNPLEDRPKEAIASTTDYDTISQFFINMAHRVKQLPVAIQKQIEGKSTVDDEEGGHSDDESEAAVEEQKEEGWWLPGPRWCHGRHDQGWRTSRPGQNKPFHSGFGSPMGTSQHHHTMHPAMQHYMYHTGIGVTGGLHQGFAPPPAPPPIHPRSHSNSHSYHMASLQGLQLATTTNARIGWRSEYLYMNCARPAAQDAAHHSDISLFCFLFSYLFFFLVSPSVKLHVRSEIGVLPYSHAYAPVYTRIFAVRRRGVSVSGFGEIRTI